MKKINKLLFVLALCITSMCFATIVSADADLSLSNIKIVCDPSSIEAGEMSDCYIIGTPDGTGTLHGMVAQAFTTQDLRLVGAAINTNISNADAKFTKVSSTNSSEGTATLNIGSKTVTFKCDALPSANQEGKTAEDYGCAIYYSKTDTDAINATNLLNVSSELREKFPDDYNSSYGMIGSIKVQLKEDSTLTGNCGEICVYLWNIENSSQYEDYQECALQEDEREQGVECGGNNSSQVGGKIYCQEIHKLDSSSLEPNPDTGTIISYAVLIAGALIAISAVAMAKKNSKFNRI